MLPFSAEALPSSVYGPAELLRVDTGRGVQCFWQGIPLDALPLARWEAIFSCLDSGTKQHLRERVFDDVASYIYYLSIQTEVGKPDRWDQLTTAEKEDFQAPDPSKLLQNSQAWHGLLRLLGFDEYLRHPQQHQSAPCLQHLNPGDVELLRMVLQTVPQIFRCSEAPLKAVLASASPQLVVKQEVKQEVSDGRLSAETCRSIERGLLDPWPAEAALWGQRLSWACLLHTLVQLARERFGVFWPQHCVLLCTSPSWCAAEKPRQPVREEGDEPAQQDKEPDGQRKYKTRKTLKQREQEFRDVAKQMADAADVSYNLTFQKLRRKNQDPDKKGHWKDFLLAVGKGSSLKCKSCQEVRSRILQAEKLREPAAHDEVPDVPQQAVVPAEPKPYKGRGRPAAGSLCVKLASLLERDRPDIYQFRHGTIWYCMACQVECNFHRSGASGWRYVQWHEGKSHEARLQKFRGLVPDADSRCEGVELGSGHNDELDRRSMSFETWIAAGMIKCTENVAKDPFEKCTLRWKQDALILMSSSCTGRGPICAACDSLSKSRMLLKAVCRWASIIDLTHFARQLVYGTAEDVRAAKEKMLSADYYKITECRQGVDEVLRLTDPVAAISLVKRRLCCIPYSKRTVALSRFMEANVMDLAHSSQGDAERRALQHLCQEFQTSILKITVRRENLQLAAKIAAGQHEASRILRCVLRSFFDREARVSRGCAQRLNTSQFVHEETAQEVFFTLGMTKNTRELLSTFGVALPSRASIDFQHPCLPRPFIANGSDEARTCPRLEAFFSICCATSCDVVWKC